MNTVFFIDDRFIDESFKFSRIFHYPEKLAENPVITKTQIWESLMATYGSVLYDEGMYKAYYTVWWMSNKPPYDCEAEGLAFAVSADGIHWEKKELNIVDEVNSGKNNLIRYGLFADQPCVLRLTEPQENKKYVMAYYGVFPPHGSGVRICYSEDGIHWDWPGELVWKTPIDGIDRESDFYAADDTISFYYDPLIKRYVILRKVMQDYDLVYDAEKHKGWQPDRDRLQRIVARCESEDLKNWTDHKILLIPDLEDNPHTEFHRLSVTPYAGQYFGLLETVNTLPEDRTTNMELLYSRDGWNWIRPSRKHQPYIRNGRKDEWDNGLIFVTPHFLVKNEEIFIYYGAMQARLSAESIGKCTRYGVGAAKLPKDRFCGLQSSTHDISLLLTHPVEIASGIKINAHIKENGFIQIALCDRETDKVIENFDWSSCAVSKEERMERQIAWRGKHVPAKGKYKLYIRAKAAELYALYCY